LGRRSVIDSSAMALTPKQQRFVDEYLTDCNATQAAIRAGYSRRTAYAIGSENMSKPEIRAALQAARAVVTTKVKITKDYLIEQANDIMLKAKANGAWAAARGANELLAKLTGHLVERRDLRVIRSIEDLSEEELRVLAGVADEEAQRARH
jgi:phage terminase small subunit